ncbi:hypothetical protein [Clostridium sp. BSD9I1]|uniref:hypothetical protein n=1 Tax=Clostridium sp. BSD9I1 TaxID=2003589 RepID=UPI00164609C8|nr:hypothetical protein [Clostridium sp. BSD9I1]
MALNYSIALAPGSPECEFNAAENRFEQTWTYIVTQTGPTMPEISHWELELCENHNVLRVSKNGTEVPIEQAANLDIEVSAPGLNDCLLNLAVRRIKWDDLSNAEVAPDALGEFNFVLEGCYQTGLVDAAIKAGTEPCDIRQVPGPICVLQPPNRGIKLSQFEE